MGAKKIRSNNVDPDFNNKRMMLGMQSGVLPDFNKNHP
jgi:hypothetical protein